MRHPARLLTTLSHPSTHSPLLPPYAFAHAPGSAPARSLTPPYQHSASPDVDHGRSQTGINSAKRYVLLEKEQIYEREWREWMNGLMERYGEARLREMWQNAIQGVEEVKRTLPSIPEIAFHNLPAHLSSSSTLKNLRRTGIVIIRDVISDQKAEYVGKELALARAERGGQAPFWHPYLLALRSHPSILSANNQLTRALAGEDAKYIKAESVGSLPRNGAKTLIDVANVWKSAQPLSAHFALTTTPSNTFTALPSTHSALYTALRPLFKALRSRISFYSTEGYLDLSNWALVDPAAQSSAGPSQSTNVATSPLAHELKLHHLTNPDQATLANLPELRPGDMIYRHPLLPIFTSTASAQQAAGDNTNAFLPLSSILANADPSAEEMVQRQREAFERGLPPDHAGMEGSVQLEQEGRVEDLGGRSGRGVMGYENSTGQR